MDDFTETKFTKCKFNKMSFWHQKFRTEINEKNKIIILKNQLNHTNHRGITEFLNKRLFKKLDIKTGTINWMIAFRSSI